MLLNTKKTATLISVSAVFLFVLDRILKYFTLYSALEKPLLGELLTFRFVSNYYIAFSIPFRGLALNILIICIILALIVYSAFLLKKRRFFESALLFVIIVGALSNGIDRLKFGFVIDYLDLKYFSVFNVADSMIVLSAIALVVFTLKNGNDEFPPSR